jgi:hypothetical protein
MHRNGDIGVVLVREVLSNRPVRNYTNDLLEYKPFVSIRTNYRVFIRKKEYIPKVNNNLFKKASVTFNSFHGIKGSSLSCRIDTCNYVDEE